MDLHAAWLTERGLVDLAKHLSGKHDQLAHGRRGGQAGRGERRRDALASIRADYERARDKITPERKARGEKRIAGMEARSAARKPKPNERERGQQLVDSYLSRSPDDVRRRMREGEEAKRKMLAGMLAEKGGQTSGGYAPSARHLFARVAGQPGWEWNGERETGSGTLRNEYGGHLATVSYDGKREQFLVETGLLDSKRSPSWHSSADDALAAVKRHREATDRANAGADLRSKRRRGVVDEVAHPDSGFTVRKKHLKNSVHLTVVDPDGKEHARGVTTQRFTHAVMHASKDGWTLHGLTAKPDPKWTGAKSPFLHLVDLSTGAVRGATPGGGQVHDPAAPKPSSAPSKPKTDRSAERAAKAITTPDGRPLKAGGRTFKTEREASAALTDAMHDRLTPPQWWTPERVAANNADYDAVIRATAEALSAKQGRPLGDVLAEYQAKAAKKARRTLGLS